MYESRLLDSRSYEVMLRNLSRLLAVGKTLAEARPAVLEQAGVRVFPDPPMWRRSGIAPPGTTPPTTIH